MYNWRKLSEVQKQEALALRQSRHLPWHSLPHLDFEGSRQYLISSACYEDKSVIGATAERMTKCETSVIEVCEEFSSQIYAWCILPNHYHALIKTDRIKELRRELGQFHGRSSFKWNGEDDRRGRKVWHNCFERIMKSERHFRYYELCAPQPSTPWIRRALAGLAVVKRDRVSGTSWLGTC